MLSLVSSNALLTACCCCTCEEEEDAAVFVLVDMVGVISSSFRCWSFLVLDMPVLLI
jgi:hypothetical protein